MLNDKDVNSKVIRLWHHHTVVVVVYLHTFWKCINNYIATLVSMHDIHSGQFWYTVHTNCMYAGTLHVPNTTDISFYHCGWDSIACNHSVNLLMMWGLTRATPTQSLHAMCMSVGHHLV